MSLQIPKNNWKVISQALFELRLGKALPQVNELEQDLKELGYYDGEQLTTKGADVARLHFVQNDQDAVREIHTASLLQLPSTQAILQSLWGMADIKTVQVRAALLFAGVDEGQANTRTGNFLSYLNEFGVLTYSKKKGTIKLIVAPQEYDVVPTHVFLNPDRPYANTYWIRQIIAECRGSILWIDKYFNKDALSWLWREALGANVSNIKIVSVLPDNGLDYDTKDDYKRFKKEMSQRGIAVEWHLLDKKDGHLIHDRWVLDDTSVCYNIPSTNSIRSGQSSELLQSTNFSDVRELFNKSFSAGKPA